METLPLRKFRMLHQILPKGFEGQALRAPGDEKSGTAENDRGKGGGQLLFTSQG